MSDEKLKILKMVEDGKISAADAAKLLSSMDTGKGTEPSPARPQTQQRPLEGSVPGGRPESFADDLGKKFDNLMKDFEPKIRDLSEKVAEQTARMADSISKSISSGSSSGSGPATARPRHSEKYNTSSYGAGTANEKNYEIRIASAGSFLNISSLNGSILLKGYNGDNISAKVYTKPRRPGASIEFMTLGNKYHLNYDEDDFERVSVDAYVPYSMFGYVALSAVNGGISASGLDCGELSVSSSNSDIILNDIKTKMLKADAQNAHEMKLSKLNCLSAELECSNGTVSLIENDIENLKLVAFNSPVNFNLSGLENYADYLWLMETSNQKITMFLPTEPEIGYYIKAQSSLGSVKIGLTGLNYIFSDRYNAEAKSIGFDTAAKKARISLETSNAPLVIN